MHAPKPLQSFQIIRHRLSRRIIRAALLLAATGGMQACARNHPNAFAGAPALQPQCWIETQHSGPRTRTFEGATARFKRRAKLSYTWSFSEAPAATVPGRQFTVTFESATPRRAARVHLLVNASDGSQTACDTVIW